MSTATSSKVSKKSVKENKEVKGMKKTKSKDEQKKVLKGGTGSKTISPPVVPQPLPEVAEKPVDVQEVVNQMVYQHGTNLAERGDYPDLLRSAGLTKQQVTKKIIEKAKKAFATRVEEDNQKVKESPPNRIQWSLEPQKEELKSGGVTHYWTSSDGKYRVDHYKSNDREDILYLACFRAKHKGGVSWQPCEHTKEGVGYPKYLKTLEAAFLMAEKFHGEQTKHLIVTSNREEVMKKAWEMGLSRSRGAMTTTPNGHSEGHDKKEGKEGSKEAKDSKPKAPSAPRSKILVLGHPLMRLVHWMGKEGWEFDRVKKAIAKAVKEDVKEVTLRTYWTDGKNPKYCKAPDLNKEEKKQVEALA